MTDIPADLKASLIELLLSIADDKFILGHRDSDWTGLGPILEEDIAFSSMAQDEIGHAYALYQFVAPLAGVANADRLAYGRKLEEYRCAAIVEFPDEFDWATAIARQFFCDRCDLLRLTRLACSSLAPLAALGARLLAEERIHVEHGDAWVRRLGKAGGEAAQRLQAAFDRLAAHATMLFEPTRDVSKLEAAGVYPRGERPMYEEWREAVLSVVAEAGLRLNLSPLPAAAAGGRCGKHTEHFGPLLDELSEVYRLEPEGAW